MDDGRWFFLSLSREAPRENFACIFFTFIIYISTRSLSHWNICTSIKTHRNINQGKWTFKLGDSLNSSTSCLHRVLEPSPLRSLHMPDDLRSQTFDLCMPPGSVTPAPGLDMRRPPNLLVPVYWVLVPPDTFLLTWLSLSMFTNPTIISILILINGDYPCYVIHPTFIYLDLYFVCFHRRVTVSMR